MIKMIVFLGNPGLQYKSTRHNAGWMCCDHIDEIRNEKWQKKFKGSWLSYGNGDTKIICLKPETFMNLSGESVSAAAAFFKLKTDEILVVHDDLEQKYGVISFRRGGGLAGHNGLKSISGHLGTKDFHRFRIGIGRPVHGSVSSWVTGRFSQEEEVHLELILSRSASKVMDCLKKEPLSLSQEKITLFQ